jgi:AcrR family transcriptional regulator
MRPIASNGVRPDYERARIARHAAKAFFQQGYEATTVDQIARQMDVTRGHIYYYYTSKAEILFRISSSLTSDLLRSIKRAAKGAAQPEDRLERALTAHVKFVIANPIVPRTSWTILYGDFPREFKKQLDKQGEEVRSFYQGLIKEIPAPRQLESNEMDDLVRLIMGGLVWMPRWYRNDRPRDPVLVGRMLQELVVGYLRGSERMLTEHGPEQRG